MSRRVRTGEAAILRSCLEWLWAQGVVCWRNNTGGMVKEYQGKTHFVRFGKKGSSDILGWLPADKFPRHPGAFFACETKQPGQRPTPDQQRFLDQVNAGGGVGLWVQSVEELERDFAELRKER